MKSLEISHPRYYLVYEDGRGAIPTVMDEYQLEFRLNYDPCLSYEQMDDEALIAEFEMSDWNNPASPMHY